MSDFSVIITTNEGTNSKTIVLDTVDDISVGGNTTITTQPMVNGDKIADHMFRHGKSLSISGTLSMNGSKGIVIDNNGPTLTNFEEEFERIQKDGIMCSIFKVSVRNEKDIRFLQRHNMVLSNLNWIEKINSLDFNFSFTEVLLTNIVQLDVAVDDAYLPNVTEPETLSFTNVLIDWKQIDAAVCSILDKEELWTIEFKTFISSFGKSAMLSLVTGGTALVIAGVISALASTSVLWTLGAIGLAATAAVIFVKGIVNAIKTAKAKKKYLIDAFKYYKNKDKKNKQEAERFASFIDGIHKEFETLDNNITVYQVSENIPQETMISVGDDYYIFTFTKNNVSQKWTAKIENLDQSITKVVSDITSSPTDFGQLTSGNALVKANNNARLYLVCPSGDKSDLTNYYIIVSAINPDDYQKLITEVISNHIYR